MHKTIIQDIRHTRRRGGEWVEGRASIREWCCFWSFCFQEGRVDEWYLHALLVRSYCLQRGLFGIAGIQRGKGWRLAYIALELTAAFYTGTLSFFCLSSLEMKVLERAPVMSFAHSEWRMRQPYIPHPQPTRKIHASFPSFQRHFLLTPLPHKQEFPPCKAQC